MSEEVQIVRDNLRSLLIEYRKLRPNLSLRSIARNTGVNRYFLGKLLDEDNDYSKLDLDQILIFCKFMVDMDPVSSSIKTQIENIKQFITPFLDCKNGVLVNLDDEKINMYDRYNFFILLLASCNYGFSRKKIISILGENAKQNLDNLLAMNKIEETDDNKIRIPEGKNTYFTSDIFRYYLSDLTRFYRPKSYESAETFSFFVQGLNSEAKKKLLELQKEYATKCNQLIYDKQNFGPHPVFALSCIGTLTDEESSDE